MFDIYKGESSRQGGGLAYDREAQAPTVKSRWVWLGDCTLAQGGDCCDQQPDKHENHRCRVVALPDPYWRIVIA